MKDKYNEIMDNVKVTDDMRSRVLGNIAKEFENIDNNSEIESAANNTQSQKSLDKPIQFKKFSRYIMIAAAVLIVAAGAITAGTISNRMNKGEVVTSDGYIEFENLESLCESIGFTIEGISDIPFDINQVSYVNISGEIGEITYSSIDEAAECLIYRKSEGTEDNSGDYSEYSQVTELENGDIKVILKGNENMYTLAIWTDENYSYSLSSADAYDLQIWEQMLGAIN